VIGTPIGAVNDHAGRSEASRIPAREGHGSPVLKEVPVPHRPLIALHADANALYPGFTNERRPF